MPTVASQRIEHLVILMLENRSFDHVFGFRSNCNGLTGSEFNLLDPNKPVSATNPKFSVKAGAKFSVSVGEGPSHSLNGTNVQIFNNKEGPAAGFPARNNGFVSNYHSTLQRATRNPSKELTAEVMQVFTASALPTINALADNFVLCDNWYCEVPGPTMPNRMYIHAATSGGYAHNVWDHIFDNQTIYNRVQDSSRTWATYDFDSNEVRQFSLVNTQAANFKSFEDSFANDVANGSLPNYSFIVPRFFNSHGKVVNSQHAPWDVRPGEHLIADVYEALVSNPAVWNKTALIVTYDENGGYYDHVIPPATGISNPDGLNSPASGNVDFAPHFKFDRLGLRVPTIIASPWVRKGKVDSTQFQHTSVLATAKHLFGLSGFLTERDKTANDFTEIFEELLTARTDTPMTLPRPSITEAALELPAGAAANPDNAPLDELQEEILIGILHLTAASQSAALESAFSLPETQSEAAALIKQRVRARFGGQ